MITPEQAATIRERNAIQGHELSEKKLAEEQRRKKMEDPDEVLRVLRKAPSPAERYKMEITATITFPQPVTKAINCDTDPNRAVCEGKHRRLRDSANFMAGMAAGACFVFVSWLATMLLH